MSVSEEWRQMIDRQRLELNRQMESVMFQTAADMTIRQPRTARPVEPGRPPARTQHVTSSHLWRPLNATNGLREAVDVVRVAIKRLNADAVACSGVSGLIVAPAASLEAGVRLLVVRTNMKYDDGRHTHATARVEGPLGAARRILIVDDMISSGRTIRFITSEIDKYDHNAKFVGVCLYLSGELYPMRGGSADECNPYPKIRHRAFD